MKECHHAPFGRSTLRLLGLAVSAGLIAVSACKKEPERLNNQGVSLLDTGEYQAARAKFERVIALDPNNALAYYNLALAWNGIAEEADELFEPLGLALANYDQALALEPDIARAHTNRAIVLRKLGRPKEAIAAFDRAIMQDPTDYRAWINRANILLRQGEVVAALEGFERGLQITPGSWHALFGSARALLLLERVEESHGRLLGAVELAPCPATKALTRSVLDEVEKQRMSAD